MASIMFRFYIQGEYGARDEYVCSEVFTSMGQADKFLASKDGKVTVTNVDGISADRMEATIYHMAGHSDITFERLNSGRWSKVGALVNHGIAPSKKAARMLWGQFWAYLEDKERSETLTHNRRMADNFIGWMKNNLGKIAQDAVESYGNLVECPVQGWRAQGCWDDEDDASGIETARFAVLLDGVSDAIATALVGWIGTHREGQAKALAILKSATQAQLSAIDALGYDVWSRAARAVGFEPDSWRNGHMSSDVMDNLD